MQLKCLMVQMGMCRENMQTKFAKEIVSKLCHDNDQKTGKTGQTPLEYRKPRLHQSWHWKVASKTHFYSKIGCWQFDQSFKTIWSSFVCVIHLQNCISLCTAIPLCFRANEWLRFIFNLVHSNWSSILQQWVYIVLCRIMCSFKLPLKILSYFCR